MSGSDKYGFDDPNLDSFKKVRIFIDRVLSPMGLDNAIRLNPALEKDLKHLLWGIDMTQMDLDARPLMIAGRKYDVKDGCLEIEEVQQDENTKSFKRTTYEAKHSKGGMVKTTDTVIGYLLRDTHQVTETYGQEHSFFTNNGVEMSSIDLTHDIGILDGIAYYGYTPQLEERHVATAYRFDSQNKLEIPKLPEDYSYYSKLDRDSNFVEQARYYETRRNENSVIQYVGQSNIHSEYGIDRLGLYGHLEDFCQKTNITTGEVSAPEHPEYLHVSPPDILLSEIKKSADATKYSTGLRSISPLQRRLVQELIAMSKGRVPVDKTFTTQDYASTSQDLKATDLSEILTVLSNLTPDGIDIDSQNKNEDERQ